MKHTPEPWKVAPLNEDEDFAEIVGSDGSDIVFGLSSVYVAIKDATRIVACVNACKNLTNEELETIPVFKNAISQSVSFYNSILPDIESWLKNSTLKQYMLMCDPAMHFALRMVADTLSDKVFLSIEDEFAYFKRK
jgi:hypothetical protein